MNTLTAWTCYGLAYVFVALYLQFYYETGTYVYVPKRLRLGNRIKAYLTRLASRWRGLISKAQSRRHWRNLPRRTRTHSGSYANRNNNNNYVHRLYAMNAVLAQQATTRKLPPNFILDSDSKPLGIDNRATAFISGDINDFDGPLHDSDRVVRGFAGIRVKGVKKGIAILRIEDDDGRVHRIKLHDSYYVPDTPDRLFSPQHFAQEMRRQKLGPASETTDDTTCILRWGGYRRTIPLDPETNVATIRTAPSNKRFMAYCAEAGFDEPGGNPIAFDASLISDDEGDDDDWWLQDDHARRGEPSTNDTRNSTGSNAISDSLQTDRGETEWSDSHLPNTTITRNQPDLIQQEDIEELKAHTDEAALLDYHYRFGHTSFTKLQTMAKNGVLPRRLAYCRVPVCASCMYGKATHRPWRHKRSANDQNTKPTAPGQTVSVDQLKSPTPGFIAQLTGALTKDRYNYATVFVDNYSSKGYVHLQRTQSAAETVEAKLAFERICQRDGVKVQHYHADNGVFRAKAWTDDCLQKQQRVTFAGVDAHHQNGRAEARIRRLQELTRSALNHAQRKWPHEINTNLWPYALRMASDSINATPNLQDKQHKGRTPDQAFSGSEVGTNPKHWKHFGSPVYVLDQALRSGSRIHGKWKDRSRIGIYLGRSPQHARSIALVLNPGTGLVSPQFHVQHDSSFDTIKQLYPSKGHSSKWQEKAGFTAPPERPRNVENRQELTSISPQALTPTSEGGENGKSQDEPQAIDHREAASQATPNTLVDSTNEPATPRHTAEPTRPPRRNNAQSNNEGVTRSGRASRPPQRLLEMMTAELSRDTGLRNELFSYAAMFPREDISDVALDIIAMKAKADPDTLYLHEARKQPDWENFADAMLSEIEQQIAAGVLIITPRSDVPEGAAVLPSVWQLRRKRDVITGDIKKYKARNNIDGSRMVEGRDYDETYAPVAGWTAIRLILAFKLLFGWHSVQLDYVLAFPQAPAVRDLYMEIPKGFTLDGVDNPADWVLKMGRNIYGGKDSGRVWYLYLVKKLHKLGFRQSQHDDCIFYKGKMIYVLYTDDSILTGPDKDEIDETIKLLASELDITHDDQLSDFLGVNIQHRDDGTIKLSQPKLIEQVINDLHLEQDHTTTKSTPAASSKLLSRHADSRPFDGHFNYRSVIGKLHYLVAGSRSEIAYAVHQCARFAQDPRMEHSKAVKWIGRYLKGTKDAGTILRPDLTKSLEVFVDADFAGNWDPDIAGQDRSTARSRHGYYICYGGIPIAWKSTLQQEIALSSTESEITGLSYALRETIPIIRLLEEMKELGYPVSGGTKVHCEVFEDNSGAIEIARKHKYRPRTKHLNNRLWHFRTYVDRGIITIHPIKSEDQPADILTKPLNEVDFKRHRLTMNGH